MTRAIARTAVTGLLLLASGGTHALGLGPATLASDLSSPLHAEIPITELIGSGIDPDALVVDVPGFNEHARLGVADPVIPVGLDVSVVRDASGGARLRLSTQRAVREPLLRFLLRASWPGGGTVREYTLLLDPPAAARPMAASTPQAAARVRPAFTAATRNAALEGNPFQQPAPARAGTRYGPVTLGDTLHAILASAYPDSPRDAMAREVLARNPHAFAGGDPNRLLLGATLQLPAAATHASIAAVSAAGPAPSVAPSVASSVAVAGMDHLVQPGDTLYAIARAIPGATEAQLASIVQRLFARNPQAFINGDMNRLRAGARLQLEATSPTADSPAIASPAMATASTASASGEGTPAAPPVQTPVQAVQTPAQTPVQTPVQAPAQVPAQVVNELRRDLGEVQRDISAQVEHRGSLRERMALLEQEIGSLRDRDAALTQASEALQERLNGTAMAAVRQPAAQQARPGASIVSPAATRPALAPTSVPVSELTMRAGSAAPALVPASATEPGSTAPAPVPAPATELGSAPPAPVPALTTPPVSAASAVAGAIPRALSEPIWLAGGAGMLLLLLVLLALRRRRAHEQSIVTEQASPPRHGDEQAARRRLAEVRDAHANRYGHAEREEPAAPATAASDNVRHTDAAKASVLAKEAAVHLAYGDHAAAHDSIVEAIRLAPHQDEYKMLLMTVYQSKGRHDKARAIVDELLNRREQLSGDVRAQVEQQVQRFGR